MGKLTSVCLRYHYGRFWGNFGKDPHINNGRQRRFDKFWDVCEIVIDALTAADDRRHETRDVVVNIALAISTKDLYEKCKTEKIKMLLEEDMPSLSWFCFQFWPKDNSFHTAFNCTGWCKVWYMMQQISRWCSLLCLY